MTERKEQEREVRGWEREEKTGGKNISGATVQRTKVEGPIVSFSWTDWYDRFYSTEKVQRYTYGWRYQRFTIVLRVLRSSYSVPSFHAAMSSWDLQRQVPYNLTLSRHHDNPPIIRFVWTLKATLFHSMYSLVVSGKLQKSKSKCQQSGSYILLSPDPVTLALY